MSCLGEPRRHVCVREPSGTVAQRIVCGAAEYSLQNEPMSNIIAICKIKTLFRYLLYGWIKVVAEEPSMRIDPLIADGQTYLHDNRHCDVGHSESGLCHTYSPCMRLPCRLL